MTKQNQIVRKTITTTEEDFNIFYSKNKVKTSKGYGNQSIYKYKVYISVPSDPDKIINFNFHGSIADYNEGKRIISDELPFAFYCFLNDACTYYEAKSLGDSSLTNAVRTQQKQLEYIKAVRRQLKN